MAPRKVLCYLMSNMVLPGPDGDNQPSASNQDDNLDILERILREPPDQDRGDQEQMLQRLSRLRDPMANLNVVNTRYGLVSPLEPTLYELLQRICASEANGEEKDVESLLRVTMRVTSRDVSLQRLHLYVPALQELVLEGSRMTSIRDLGCDLVNLKLLNISNCGLDSLDGTNGLPVTLEKLYAARNRIRDVICVVSLEGLQLLDLSGNRVRDISTLGFLTLCEELRSIFLANCPCADIPDFRRRVRKLMPHLHELDGIPFQEEDDEGSEEYKSKFIQSTSDIKNLLEIDNIQESPRGLKKLNASETLCGNLAKSLRNRQAKSTTCSIENKSKSVANKTMETKKFNLSPRLNPLPEITPDFEESTEDSEVKLNISVRPDSKISGKTNLADDTASLTPKSL
ncbi:uncharacterized protein LOC113385040 [Ctenocephalides felis]|uniref:uncharacterized protein LOC113385040 n=1 Tax=Ctenocephalides felis TaxID=7515 RepID=UPI000E6E4A8D|nr:uncharacterized protein LOC113385040 [Ctenocephalides felis]